MQLLLHELANEIVPLRFSTGCWRIVGRWLFVFPGSG